MSLKRIFAIYLRQIYLISKNKTRILSIFYWSLLDLILWGFITNYLDQTSQSKLSFVTVILGALILINLLFRIQNAISMAFLEDVWARNFLNLFSSPLKLSEYAAGIVLTGITTSIFAFIALILVAWLAFAYNIFTLGFYLVPFLLVILLFGVFLGLINTAIVLRLGPSAEFFAWAIPALFTPLVGVFYPISALPILIQPISKLIPVTYAFEGMREVILTGVLSWGPLLIGICLAILYLIFAYLLLVWIYRGVVKNGLLARFTAELG